MARRAFTLIELLVIVAIIGIMTTVAILSVASGQTAVRVKGATRDVFAAIRHARSTALVTQKPAIITYSNTRVDEESVAKIEITSATLFHTVDRSNLQTITGEPIKGLDDEAGIVEPKSAADETGTVHAGSDDTSIFIYPGYQFRAMDALITNFHLPESTLIMLVSAFAGRENVLEAYKQAVDMRYRFFSFGDAMMII